MTLQCIKATIFAIFFASGEVGMALVFYSKKTKVSHFSLFGLYAHLDGSIGNLSGRRKVSLCEETEGVRMALSRAADLL